MNSLTGVVHRTQLHRIRTVLLMIGKFKTENRVVKLFKNSFFFFNTNYLEIYSPPAPAVAPNRAQRGAVI